MSDVKGTKNVQLGAVIKTFMNTLRTAPEISSMLPVTRGIA